MSFTIKTAISDARMEDLLCAAFEGGIGYWAEIKGLEGEEIRHKYSFQLPVRGGAVIFGDSTGEGFPEGFEAPRLDRQALERGLELMAKNCPSYMADFVNENEDAITGDVFVQLCVFGEVVFG